MLKKSLFLACTMLLTEGTLLADQFHYANFIIGERAMGLGGAFTAVADDASGIFYNPAGLGFALNSDICGSANAYYSKETVYKDTLGSNNYTEKSSGTANPFFGGLQKLDHILPGLAAGFAVYVTDNEFKEQDDLIEDVELSSGNELKRLQRTVSNRSETLGIAAAIAKKFKGGFSVGFGLAYLTASELQQDFLAVQQNTIYVEQNTKQAYLLQDYTSRNVFVKLNAGAIETSLGAQYAIGTVAMGVNVKIRSIISQDLKYAADQLRIKIMNAKKVMTQTILILYVHLRKKIFLIT